jgi:hypothetical protein
MNGTSFLSVCNNNACKREGMLFEFNPVIGVEHYCENNKQVADSRPIYGPLSRFCFTCFNAAVKSYRNHTNGFEPIIRGKR